MWLLMLTWYICVLHKSMSEHSRSTQVVLAVGLVSPGAHEPPKAVKEHATYAACQVPSQSKFIEINCQLPLNSFHIWKLFCLIIKIVSEKIRKLLKMCNIIWIVMEPRCMFLRRLQQLMGSWLL